MTHRRLSNHAPLRLLFKDISEFEGVSEEELTRPPNNRPNDPVTVWVKGDSPFVILTFETLSAGGGDDRATTLAVFDGDDWEVVMDGYEDVGLPKGIKFTDVEICAHPEGGD